MKSARSKKLDQKYLSKAELRKGGEAPRLVAILKVTAASFKTAAKLVFGARWWSRLQASADRAKKSPLGYALDVLCK